MLINHNIDSVYSRIKDKVEYAMNGEELAEVAMEPVEFARGVVGQRIEI